MMHFRVVDDHGVVHYADKVWHRDVAGELFAKWCDLGRAKTMPPLEKLLLEAASPRNQAVTCLQCLYLRHGARRG